MIVSTLTPLRMGSLLIMSMRGGLARGVPVVVISPSRAYPYTFVGSHRLRNFNEQIEQSAVE